jgi:hypothetical protein
MSLTEHENVEMISKLILQCQSLERELEFKSKENFSLQKNLDIMQTNFEVRKENFQKEIKNFIRTSDLEKEKETIDKLILEDKVQELELEIKALRKKMENM